MESTLDIEATRIPQTKTKQRIGLQNKPERHMIEISSKDCVVGPTRARSYSTILYKAVHMTYEVSPSQHSQGLFKTILCFVLVCGIRVASMSSVDTIPFLNSVLIFLGEY